MEKVINRDLMARNPETLLDEYTNYFIDKAIPYREIKKEKSFIVSESDIQPFKVASTVIQKNSQSLLWH